MLPIRFEDISAEDILRLVEEKTAEHKTLEYKSKLTIATSDEKAEFLADISSFANASGGDIIFGIADERDGTGQSTGVPSAITPLGIDNTATQCARIEQIIETGVQPRIPLVQVKTIAIESKGFVIVIRIGKSWAAPHMVTFSNRSRFYSRNSSTGKVQLDVQQIGAAFAVQRSLGERLRSWKADRISKAIAGEGPVLLTGPRMLLHLVTATALTETQSLPRVFDPNTWGRSYRLLGNTGYVSTRYNADGLLAVSALVNGTGQSYLQVFRDASLEYGDSYTFTVARGGLPSQIIERAVAQTFGAALEMLGKLDAVEPIFVGLTLLGMKGRQMALPNMGPSFNYQSDEYDRDVIVSPDVLVKNIGEGYPYPSSLLPLINSIWQGAGLACSPYVRSDGTWKP